MHVAIIILLVAIGSVVFHIYSPYWWTPIASNWGFMDTTIIITFWITGVVFVAVLAFTAYCVWRFRHREGHRADYEPENSKLEWWLTIVTSIGVAAMLAPGLVVWKDFVTVPEEATEIEAVGQQWRWSFRLPGEDGQLGATDPRRISDDNPFGVDPDDPTGRDDVLVDDDEVHLPLGKPVKVLLRSIDVLHDFYVPQFRAKMDMVPGMITFFWLTPTRTGEFEIMCFELCGTGHYAMRGIVVVDEQSEYDAWLSEQETFEDYLARAREDAGEESDLVMREQTVPQSSAQ